MEEDIRCPLEYGFDIYLLTRNILKYSILKLDYQEIIVDLFHFLNSN